MKTKLLFGIVICLSMSLNAQNVWTGTEDDLWSNENNWSGTVPTSSEDVLIPSGFVVTLDTPTNILSIEVQGNSVLNVTETLIIQNPSEFEMNVVVNWVSGDLIGPGILLNSGTINLSSPSFDISGSAVLNNPGTINLSSGGSISINTDSVLNNSGTGTIDFQMAGSSINAVGPPPNTFNNFGTIKTSMPDPLDECDIAGTLINTDGIFQIDSGTLELNTTANNFMGGMFNVAAGATLEWNGPIDAIGVFTGNVFGDLNWDADLSVASTAVFNFSGNGIIKNTGGDLTGGGTLTNQSTISTNLTGFMLTGGTTLENSGTIQLASTGDITIGANSTINNSASGLIEMLENSGNINSFGIADDTRVLNNSGIIRANLPNTSDDVFIGIKLNNNDGTIEVLNGTLNLNYGGITLSDGIYNINTNGVLNWSFPITISGNLTGVLDGGFNWGADIVVPTSATFNLSGNGIINWVAGDIEGGGVLTNENTIIKSTGGTKRINGGSTLNNNGTFNQIVGGTIGIATNSTLNNNASGVINLDASTSGFSSISSAPNQFNNLGTLNSNVSSGTGSAFISAQLSNSGLINVIQNSLTFNGAGTLTNETNGEIMGVGTLVLPVAFTNNGIFSPGASPGTLTLVNNFTSNGSSIINIELNGNDQGVTYDLLSIDGDADLNGSLDVTLGFSPNVTDEFIVLETQVPDTINTCNLPPTVMASFGGFDYEFDVVCRNNNELVLTVLSETLSLETTELTDIKVFPNPTKDLITITDESIISIKVYDLNGREVAVSTTNSLSIKNLNDGIYILSASNSRGESIIRKVIKH